jgi:DnaJ-class molecular chaperone
MGVEGMSKQVPCEICTGFQRERGIKTEECQCCQGTGLQPLIEYPNPFDDTAEERARAERQGGFDRPSAFDPHDGGSE